MGFDVKRRSGGTVKKKEGTADWGFFGFFFLGRKMAIAGSFSVHERGGLVLHLFFGGRARDELAVPVCFFGERDKTRLGGARGKPSPLPSLVNQSHGLSTTSYPRL